MQLVESEVWRQHRSELCARGERASAGDCGQSAASQLPGSGMRCSDSSPDDYQGRRSQRDAREESC